MPGLLTLATTAALGGKTEVVAINEINHLVVGGPKKKLIEKKGRTYVFERNINTY